MKKFSLYSLLFIITVLLTGCVEVPAEVYEEWYLYRSLTPAERHTNQKDTNIEKDTIAVCKQQALNYQGQSYKQFTFPEYFDIPDTKKIYTYKPVSFPYYDHFNELIDAFFTPGLSSLNQKNYKKQSSDWKKDYGKIWSSTDGSSIVWINNGGTFQITNPHTYQYDEYQCKRVNTYWLENTAIAEDSYHLSDGNMTVSEAITMANTYIKKLQDIEDHIWTYTPYVLYVCQVSDEDYAYSFVYKYSYDGIPFDPVPDYPVQDVDDYDSLWGGDALLLTISNHNGLDSISKYGVTESKTEETSYTKIVSLKSAIDIISSNLDNASPFQFDEVSLSYIYQIDNPVNQMNGERKYDTFELDDSSRSIRPFWVFSINMNPTNAVLSTHNLRSTVIIVDAINGQMQYFHGNNYTY